MRVTSETILANKAKKSISMGISCGARSASELKEKDYLRSMLPRRQLQGIVSLRFIVIYFPVRSVLGDRSQPSSIIRGLRQDYGTAAMEQI
jgi:hypothetical protein